GITGATVDDGLRAQSVTIIELSADMFCFVHVSGDFAFQEDANGIRAAASGVSATLSAGSASLGVSSGSLSLLLNNDNSKVLEARSEERRVGEGCGNERGRGEKGEGDTRK